MAYHHGISADEDLSPAKTFAGEVAREQVADAAIVVDDEQMRGVV